MSARCPVLALSSWRNRCLPSDRSANKKFDLAWRLLGGHPQAMEYLDSLLATGYVRFPEVASRLAVAVEGKSGSPARPEGPAAPTELAPAAAESVALAARDLLLRELGGPSPAALPRWAAGPLRRLPALQHRGRPRAPATRPPRRELGCGLPDGCRPDSCWPDSC